MRARVANYIQCAFDDDQKERERHFVFSVSHDDDGDDGDSNNNNGGRDEGRVGSRRDEHHQRQRQQQHHHHQRSDFTTTRVCSCVPDECERLPHNGRDWSRVSGVVWKASIPSKSNETVAIKVLDLEDQDQNYLEEIRREAQTMSMLSHPNLVRYHCSFIEGSSLWVVMPYLEGGSVLNLMKWKHVQESSIENDGAQRRGESGEDDGESGVVVECINHNFSWVRRNDRRDHLERHVEGVGLLPCNGNIHRDVKAGNILVDANGDVKLADFGVSASSWGSGGRPRSHQTFVGTPCWMAPEVMEQVSGYDFHADIWSLGITVLELCHGHAPFAKYPPMKVLLMTLQNPPPTLESSAQTGIVGGGGRAKETLLESVERVCRFVLTKRSKQKAFRREVVGTQVFKRSQEVGLHRQDVVERYSKFR